MEPSKVSDEEALFEHTIKSLEGQVANVGAHLTVDTQARLLYVQEIKQMSDRLRAAATAGRITWAAAAREAQETRNLIMGIVRARSTPVGRAFAEALKIKGYSLNQLIAAKTIELYGESQPARSSKVLYSKRLSSGANTSCCLSLMTCHLKRG